MSNVQRISDTWYRAENDVGVFFGYTEVQAIEKAEAAERRALIAEAERGSFLHLNERQRGVKVV
ncbi:MAG: hypothetical protein Hals2KO_21270 [Halioglobus sp.]